MLYEKQRIEVKSSTPEVLVHNVHGIIVVPSTRVDLHFTANTWVPP